jgi:hypothetical protein
MLGSPLSHYLTHSELVLIIVLRYSVKFFTGLPHVGCYSMHGQTSANVGLICRSYCPSAGVGQGQRLSQRL